MSSKAPKNVCKPCAAEAVSAGGTGAACAACPSLQAPNANNSACTAPVCPPGQGVSGSACAACATNTVSAGGEGAVCTTCAAGTKPNALKAACVPSSCPAGSGLANDVCAACNATSTVSAGGEGAVCSACAGALVPNAGNTACVDLPPFVPPVAAEATPYNYSMRFAGADYDAITANADQLAAFSARLRYEVAAGIVRTTGRALSSANVHVRSLRKGSIVADVAIFVPISWEPAAVAALDMSVQTNPGAIFTAAFLSSVNTTAVDSQFGAWEGGATMCVA